MDGMGIEIPPIISTTHPSDFLKALSAAPSAAGEADLDGVFRG